MAYQTRVPYSNTTSYQPRRIPTTNNVQQVVKPAAPPVKGVKLVYFWIVVVIAVILGILVGVLYFLWQNVRKTQFDATLCPTYIPPTTCPSGCTGTPTG